jgi:N-methylhydantoinase A
MYCIAKSGSWRAAGAGRPGELPLSYVVAVDIGGTFTDLVAFDRVSNRVVYTKCPTTYGDFGAGILDCFAKVGLDPADVDLINHGTTLVINALIQRQGARAALVTTKGFRDILEIARGNRPDPFDLYFRRDEPLIPRNRRFELNERMDAGGAVITPLDSAEIETLATQLRELDVDAVAICFLHAYANPAHELQAAKALRKALPGVFITNSVDLSREWYEYERTSTVAANAFVGPDVNSYIRKIEGELKGRGFGGTLYLMGSNGGVLSVERTCRQPIALVESGPIGGCIGAAAYAEALGIDHAIAFDMGGTTAKCALVENGRFGVESVYYAAGYVKGFPIKSPVVDIVEVGAGGGSIAWADAQQRLHVGPKSAGSTPGPVCYGRGGTEPTITDANLLLGRINPDRFLGGELKLDEDALTDAFARLGEPLGYSRANLLELADGIVEIATVTMAGAIRQVSVEHGRDPRDFVLIAYGGGGPLHGTALARELSIPTVIVPPEPGTFSATGMLLAEARLDDTVTLTSPYVESAVPEIDAAFARMEADAAAALRVEFGDATVRVERMIEMRYVGQRHNVKVPVSAGGDFAAIRDAFDSDYRRRYGHADASIPAEVQALHISAFARLDRPDISRLPRAKGVSRAMTQRKIAFGREHGLVDADVYDRYDLEPGFSAVGPAVLEEYGSTTVVWPGDRFTIGNLYELRIDCARKENA